MKNNISLYSRAVSNAIILAQIRFRKKVLDPSQTAYKNIIFLRYN